MARGRAVWNAHCYFCHGYGGDARTEAARVLAPPPRDLTRAADLTRARIREVLAEGSPGTAMKPFADRLSPDAMDDLASFVLERFVRCGAANTRYHTPANGWADHEQRHAAAFPFVRGEIALDAPDRILTPGEQAGRALFRSTCIGCHDGRIAAPAPLSLGTPGAPASERHDPWSVAHHDDDYETPTIHDLPPEIPDLTPAEAAGRDLYARACAACHAADGSGRNWIGAFLQPNPPDFRSAAHVRSFDPRAFRDATLDGGAGTTMPSFRGVLTEAEAAAIAAYVARAFVAQGPRPAQAGAQ